MRECKCIVFEEDKFSKELILSFINETNGVSLINESCLSEADVIFIDTFLYQDYSKKLNPDCKVVLISSDEQSIHSYFKNDVTDFINKSKMSYSRFLESIEKVRIQLKD